MSKANPISAAFVAAGDRSSAEDRSAKKNFAERFSRELATVIARSLRPYFDGIIPDEDGGQQESRARTSKGYKKLDVNYSTPELGLGLGVSIKTLNYRDQRSKRYTKNYSRIDNELRAEALDYHVRQPYSVFAGVLFLPIDSCDDGSKRTPSSFGAAVRSFRHRAGREGPEGSPELFERFYIGLYDEQVMKEAPDAEEGCVFFDVTHPPPRARRLHPEEGLSYDEFIAGIRLAYDLRNDPPFEWADG